MLHPTGEINGKPVGPSGTSSFTVQVTDQESPPAMVTASESITVTVTPLTVTTVTLAAATAGVPYSAALAAAGGVGPYSWSIAQGSLPAGLTLHAATGVISGIPKAGGNFDFFAEVTDSEAPVSHFAGAYESITVGVAGLVVTTGSILPTATSGVPYSVKLAAAGGITPYQWSLVSGSLPAGLKLKSTGVISGTTTATGADSFTVQVTDSEAPAVSATENISLYVVNPIVVPTGLPGALVGEPYDASLQPAGGTGPFSYAVTAGSLPPGLVLQPDGEITGQATTDGTSSFTVSVTDSENPPATVTQAESITVTGGPIVFNQASLGTETVNFTADRPLVAYGGVQPFTVAITSGAVPPGQDVDQAGDLVGAPTQAGTYEFTVQITDSSSPPQTVSQDFTVTVIIPLQITTTSLPDAIEGQPYSATVAAIGGAGPPYVFSIVVSSLPDGLSLDADTGIISGTPTITSTTTVDEIDFDVSDTANHFAGRGLKLTVIAPLSASSGALADGTATISYTDGPTISGGLAPYTMSLASGTLPPGLSVDSAANAVDGDPTADGTYDFALTITDSLGSSVTVDESITITNP